MAAWAKVKLFWQTMLGSTGSTLTAGTTATGFSVASIYSMLEVNSWLAANTTSPVNIDLDLGSGNTATADYLAVYGHNIFAITGKVSLWCSNDNFATDIRQAGGYVTPTHDGAFVSEFTAPTASRYWRFVIEKVGGGSFSTAPYMTICIWGNKTELAVPTSSFDPHRFEDIAEVSITQGGIVAGIHIRHTERNIDFSIAPATLAVYAKVKSWRETHSMNQLFLAWENANNPDDIWLVRPETTFNNPLRMGALYRDITLSFKGRKV